MASEPKPMDPERLAHVRVLLEPLCFTSAVQVALVSDLLADRDFQAARADVDEQHYARKWASAAAKLAMVEAERDRARELLAGARQQCDRRTAELAEAQVSIRHLQREAVVGHFVLGLEVQIRRLRRLAEQRPQDFPTGMSPTEIAAVVAGELAEVGLEVPGSPDAQRESADVWVGALHLLLAHGGIPLVELEAAHGRIKQRLDVMEARGCSWSQAKRFIDELVGEVRALIERFEEAFR